MCTLYLDSSLDWFHGHVLLKGRATLKLDHCLIDGHFAVRMVGVCEAAREVVDQGPHLPKPVMPIHTARNQGLVVGKWRKRKRSLNLWRLMRSAMGA